MLADFWAGYISGAIGVIVGNPLDLIKVKLQAVTTTSSDTPSSTGHDLHHSTTFTPPTVSSDSPTESQETGHASGYFPTASSLLTGATAPVLTSGALGAALYIAYNRSLDAIGTMFSHSFPFPFATTPADHSLWTVWTAGMISGLAVWIATTPTELIKCQAQITSASSFDIVVRTWHAGGIRALYTGGSVTALRDSVGYGFYFWAYELLSRLLGGKKDVVLDVLFCGGVAGIVSWTSVFPLDVVKTRVQTQNLTEIHTNNERTPLLGQPGGPKHPVELKGVLQITAETYRKGGIGIFFNGLAVCTVRAFMVNAVQWWVYEFIMAWLGSVEKGQAGSWFLLCML